MKLENLERANDLKLKLKRLENQFELLNRSDEIRALELKFNEFLDVQYVNFTVLKAIARINMQEEKEKILKEIESL